MVKNPTEHGPSPQDAPIGNAQASEITPYQLDREDVIYLMGGAPIEESSHKLEELPGLVSRFFPHGIEHLTHMQAHKAAEVFRAALRNLAHLSPLKKQ